MVSVKGLRVLVWVQVKFVDVHKSWNNQIIKFIINLVWQKMVQFQIISSHHKWFPHSCQTVKKTFIGRVFFDCSLHCFQVRKRPFTEAFDHFGFGVFMNADFKDEQNKKLKMFHDVIQVAKR